MKISQYDKLLGMIRQVVRLKKLFGTDGIRGVANRDLTPVLCYHLGRASAAVLAQDTGKRRPFAVIGRDTRISGDMLEAAMAAGFASAGVDVHLLGVIPTPGVAHLTVEMGADVGVVISASHNPVEYNGVKLFARDGYKLVDEVEARIEDLVFQFENETVSGNGLLPVGGGIGRLHRRDDAVNRYADFLCGTIDVKLDGLHVVVDCAHGASYQVAPLVLRRLGAEVHAINTEPTGTNINVDCGSTAPQVIQAAVRDFGADVGLTHDGDADRVLAADENGDLVNGDRIMAICALDMIAGGRLPGNTIAATVYSNLGLMKALEQAGGRVIVTKNGDRYVLETMRQHGLALGGEQSGHIIFLDHSSTGDGILTALQLLAIMKRTGKPLSELAGVMQPCPQVLMNVAVRSKEGWSANKEIAAAIENAERRLGKDGRILVRASGTEPLIRVMGEGSEEELVREAVKEIGRVIGCQLN